MKLADLRKDDSEDMVDVKSRVSADFVRAVEKAGIPVERVICAAFEEVHAKLLKEAVVDALEKPLEREKPLAQQGPSGLPSVQFDVEKAKKLREQGLTLLQVAKEVGVSYSTLRRSFAGTRFNRRRRKSRALNPVTKYVQKNGNGPKKLRNQSKWWTPEQLSKLAAFYHDKSNHYKNGLVRGDKLGQFARAIGKTYGSVSVKMGEIGLTKTKVYGSRRKRAPDTVKPSDKTMKRFVRLPTNVDADVTKNVIKDMINGRPLRQLDMMAIGIDNEDAWVLFVQAFIVKSTKIADYFEVPDKFYVVRSNKKGRMYSNVGYKQGKFGG